MNQKAMVFRFVFISFQLTIYWLDLTVSKDQQKLTAAKENVESKDTKCTDDRDCKNGFCHKLSKLCICSNGDNSFPSCIRDECTTCGDKCDPLEYFDNAEKKCKCRHGGMSTQTCCKEKCKRLEACHNGKCVCSFGETSSNQCRRCKDDCGTIATCQQIETHHVCVCESGGTFPYCYNGKWSDWSSCDVTCGNGRQTRKWECKSPVQCLEPKVETKDCKLDTQCVGHWGPWQNWSRCSKSCGLGKRSRRRPCVTSLPCVQGKDTDFSKCKKSRCKKNLKWCENNCKEFSFCNEGNCFYHCKRFQKCFDCRSGCPRPVPAVDCQWCKWSSPKEVKNDADCKYFIKRSRTPNCPAASGGGKPCEGPAEETQGETTTETKAFSVDFAVDQETNQFSQVCLHGCNIIQQVFDCDTKDTKGQDKLYLVRKECQLNDSCIFTPSKTFFKRTDACTAVSSEIKIISFCKGGINTKLVEFHKNNMEPYLAKDIKL